MGFTTKAFTFQTPAFSFLTPSDGVADLIRWGCRPHLTGSAPQILRYRSDSTPFSQAALPRQLLFPGKTSRHSAERGSHSQNPAPLPSRHHIRAAANPDHPKTRSDFFTPVPDAPRLLSHRYQQYRHLCGPDHLTHNFVIGKHVKIFLDAFVEIIQGSS